IDGAGKQLCEHPVAGAVLYAGVLQLDQHARFRLSKFLLRVMSQTQTCVVAQQRWFVLRFTLIQAEIGRNKRVGLWQEQRLLQFRFQLRISLIVQRADADGGVVPGVNGSGIYAWDTEGGMTIDAGE